MALTFNWNGTILTISDGTKTESVDLKGKQGDRGVRGAQGRAGVILNADGTVDMTGYATEQYVEDALSDVNVDLTGYATESYVDNTIANAIDNINFPETDLTGYATEEYVNNAVSNVDVDLTGYATEEYVDAQIDNINVSVDGYATEEFVRVTVANAQLEGAEVDLSDYALKSDTIGWKGTGAGSERFNFSVNKASGDYSHAEGGWTEASGGYSHAEGRSTEASGAYSHAEGYETIASELCSHAEGYETTASGGNSHAEGSNTIASGSCSHAEGYYTKASSFNQHAQGRYNIEDAANKYAHIVGNGTSDTNRSNAHTLDWSGNAWFKGNVYVGGTSMDDATLLDSSSGSVDLSNYYTKSETYTKTEVDAKIQSGSTSSGGVGASGTGTGSEIFNKYDGENVASGSYSHAEGSSTEASGNYGAHAEGCLTVASGSSSHAEGRDTEASGDYGAHAEGAWTIAAGDYSHAEGSGTKANGKYSHAEGVDTVANGVAQHVQGRANIEDTEGKYAHIVGNGKITTPTSRSNCHTLDWDGNAWFKGKVYVGGTSMDDATELGTGGGSVDLSDYYTKTEVDAAIDAIEVNGSGDSKHYRIADCTNLTEEDIAMFNSWLTNLPLDWYIKINNRYTVISVFGYGNFGLVFNAIDGYSTGTNATTGETIWECVLAQFVWYGANNTRLSVNSTKLATEERVLELIQANMPN